MKVDQELLYWVISIVLSYIILVLEIKNLQLDWVWHLERWTRQFRKKSPVPGFWKHIHSDKNPSLWKNLRCNGDGLWLRQGLCSGSLLIVHDESYMKEVSSHVCSAAVMIVCESTGSICKCTIAEYSLSASSYCGEILGAILAQLVLLAVVKGRMGPYPMVAEDCDNNGVVLHGNKPFHPLPRSQT